MESVPDDTKHKIAITINTVFAKVSTTMLGPNHDIMFFAPNLGIGGYERVVVNLANGFAENGINTEILLCEKEGEFLDNVSEEVSLSELDESSRRGPQLIRYIPSIISRLKRDPPELLYTGMNHVNVISLLSWQLAGEPCPIVVSEHNPPRLLEGTKNTALSVAARRLYPKANAVISVSELVTEELSNYIGLPKDDVTTIHNPININEIREKANHQPPCNWFSDNQTLLSVGRLHEQKDYPTLLDAFEKFYQDHKNVKLGIIGTGPSRPQVRDKIESLGLTESVKLLGQVDNPYWYMGHASLFVLSSRWEGFGNVLVEALACGCPVVSTNCAGPSEILSHGKYGKLVPTEDAEALANAMETAFSEDTSKKRLKSRADEFSVECSVEEHGQLFQRALLD